MAEQLPDDYDPALARTNLELRRAMGDRLFSVGTRTIHDGLTKSLKPETRTRGVLWTIVGAAMAGAGVVLGVPPRPLVGQLREGHRAASRS
jgi:hypothetical protein